MIYKVVPFDYLKGYTIKSIEAEKHSELVTISTIDGDVFELYALEGYYNDVRVYLEDIVGDLDDLLNSPVLLAEEVSQGECPTWTFYKLSTIKGSVTLRWYGESNGCYSESADLILISRKLND